MNIIWQNFNLKIHMNLIIFIMQAIRVHNQYTSVPVPTVNCEGCDRKGIRHKVRVHCLPALLQCAIPAVLFAGMPDLT